MAATGLVLFLFIVAHLLGNLLVFAGPDSLNAYAKKLRDLGSVLWMARIFLLSALVIHIWAAVKLTIENRRARPVRYAYKATIETTYAARTMMISGLIVFAYIIYHLLHFTFRVTNPRISHMTDAMGHHDVYSMVVLSFQNLWITFTYVLAMALLCIHLSHGISSMFQSLGFNNEKSIPMIQKVARITALIIFLGYASIPFSILFRWVRLPGGVL